MKFSERWVREWVNPRNDTESLVNQLTMAGLEVDSVQSVSGKLENVVFAEIISIDSHPNAENLKICLVSTGSEELQIVCGAPNAVPGIRVALACIGAVLPSGEKIKETNDPNEVADLIVLKLKNERDKDKYRFKRLSGFCSCLLYTSPSPRDRG